MTMVPDKSEPTQIRWILFFSFVSSFVVLGMAGVLVEVEPSMDRLDFLLYVFLGVGILATVLSFWIPRRIRGPAEHKSGADGEGSALAASLVGWLFSTVIGVCGLVLFLAGFGAEMLWAMLAWGLLVTVIHRPD